MSDEQVTVAGLREAVEAFVSARGWGRFHNPKDLAVSIAIEAAELLEEFQWQDAEAVAQTGAEPASRERVRLELADVLIYCLALGNALDLDVSAAVLDKLELAGQKYPVSDYHGRYRRPERRGDFTVD